MEIKCKKCNTKFMIPDDKLPSGQVVALKCPKCKSKLEVATPASTPKTTIVKAAQDTGGSLEKSLDFVEAGVETALICEQDAGVREKIRSILQQMDYHVTVGASARDTMKYMRLRVFDLVFLDENFEGQGPKSNHVLQYLGHQPMGIRRNIFVVLLGNGFRTADNMTAFNLSVNLVVNLNDINQLDKILKRSLIDYEEFYRVLKRTLKTVGRA
jgi:predicted Zn finger-like uncharacterized protein